MSQRTVVLRGPDGEDYAFTIRRLGADEMISTGVIPDESNGTTEAVEAAAVEFARAGQFAGVAHKVDMALVRGLVEPRVWSGPAETCPASGWIPLGDLGHFRDRLFVEIIDFLKVKEESREAVRFPDPVEAGALGGDAGAAVGGAADGAPVASATG